MLYIYTQFCYYHIYTYLYIDLHPPERTVREKVIAKLKTQLNRVRSELQFVEGRKTLQETFQKDLEEASRLKVQNTTGICVAVAGERGPLFTVIRNSISHD